MLADRNYPWLASIVDPGLCGHINNVATNTVYLSKYIESTRIDRRVLLLLFAETRQTARMSVVHTLGARFVSRVRAQARKFT